jgi:branched-chain amino acid transport system ATP-binding protein
MSTTPLLQISDLRAGYGRAEVLHGVSLHADKGSVITVIGPNGAGKSTLLNTLMGMLPGQGRIEFDGQDMTRLTLEERVMQGMALVPEKRELFGTMTVEDNLLLGGYRQMRLGNKQWRDRLADVFDIFPRLQERQKQLAGTLSGGERQMLAVGRALMGRPTLLMLDEPLFWSSRTRAPPCRWPITATCWKWVNSAPTDLPTNWPTTHG